MSKKYVSPSNLERYDGKIKEYIDEKIGSGTGVGGDYVPLSGGTMDTGATLVVPRGTVEASTFVGNLTGMADSAEVARQAYSLLSTHVGSTIKPIYFDENGKPIACDYTLEANVPSDAKFTDTVYDDSALALRVTNIETDYLNMDGGGSFSPGSSIAFSGSK